MNVSSISDLRDFHQFVGDNVNNGCALSPEAVAAIQEAIDDMENGDPGNPFEEFDASFGLATICNPNRDPGSSVPEFGSSPARGLDAAQS